MTQPELQSVRTKSGLGQEGASSAARAELQRGRVASHPRWASTRWLLLLGLAAFEVIALLVRSHSVPPPSDFEQVADVVRGEYAAGDALIIAPYWADPLLRLHLGDVITPKMAGYADLASFERLWVVSMRGARAPEQPAREPDYRRSIGRLSVERYDFAPSPVVLDLVDALASAQVEITRDGSARPCAFHPRVPGSQRGGLGAGPLAPRQRFVCDPRIDWAWVGVTTLEDLSLRPRRCVYQHPTGEEPVAVTYPDIDLGDHLVLYAGIDYHKERNEVHAPVVMQVFVNGHPMARFVHRDGEGFVRYEVPLRALPTGEALPKRGDLRIETTTTDAADRVFCWSGTIRDAEREETP